MVGVSSVSSISDAAYASMDSMMGAASTATSAAEKCGALKSIWTFLSGEWGQAVGQSYRTAKLADPKNTSILKFNWKDTYISEVGKMNAAKAAGATKGFWGKLMGKLGPIFTAIAFGPRIVKAFINDGICEGLKETAKAAVSLAAFAIGSVIVGMLGLTGILGFAATLLIPMAVSIVADKGANMVLGESKEEQREVQIAQEKELQKNQNNFDVYKNDPMMAILKKRFDERNNFNPNPLTPATTTGSRNSYFA